MNAANTLQRYPGLKDHGFKYYLQNLESLFYGLSYMLILINSTCQGQNIKSSIVLSYLLSAVVFIVLEDL